MFRSNISDIARVFKRTAKSKSMFYQLSAAMEDVIEDAFQELVTKTPQWSGTTAASWNIGFYNRNYSDAVRTQPEPKSAQEALQRGAASAVNVALSANKGKVKGLLQEYGGTSDLFVVNQAPGVKTSVFGPVRAVNQPVDAYDSFLTALDSGFASLDNRNIDLLHGK